SALFKVSNSGDVLVEKKLYSNVETLAFDREVQRLWVGTRRSVKAYDTDGLEVMQLPFSRWIRIKRIAFDEKFNELWVATLGSLRRFDREGNQIFKERVYGIRQLASDGKGAAWVAGTKFALKINRDGDFLDRVRIPRRGGIFGDIAIDQNDGLLWALTSRYITREQVGNKYLELLHRHRKKRHIAANGDIHPPIVAIIQPEQDAIVTPRPELELGFIDIGLGIDPATIRLTVDGQDLPLECNATEVDATCTLLADLPVGTTEFSVSVSDYAGNNSAAANVGIRLDTDGDGVEDERDNYPTDPTRWRLDPVTGVATALEDISVRVNWDPHPLIANTAGYNIFRTEAGVGTEEQLNDELI
ncbi:MAG: hypothetical protein MJA83_06095, partial [Gammaproteobacteria bacterium]|nr:hypothetical protein [Gammaproteobacteria bacterium]